MLLHTPLLLRFAALQPPHWPDTRGAHLPPYQPEQSASAAFNTPNALCLPHLLIDCTLLQDRCHRIGQTREVHIYRLISQNTIEENILRKSDQKRQLDWLAIQSGGFNTEMLAKLNLGAWRIRGFGVIVIMLPIQAIALMLLAPCPIEFNLFL
jgi:hypothetical protein